MVYSYVMFTGLLVILWNACFQRDLASILAMVQNNPAAQSLPADDKALLEELIRATESHTLTPVIHREGYAKIVQLIEGNGQEKYREMGAFICAMYLRISHQKSKLYTLFLYISVLPLSACTNLYFITPYTSVHV